MRRREKDRESFRETSFKFFEEVLCCSVNKYIVYREDGMKVCM